MYLFRHTWYFATATGASSSRQVMRPLRQSNTNLCGKLWNGTYTPNENFTRAPTAHSLLFRRIAWSCTCPSPSRRSTATPAWTTGAQQPYHPVHTCPIQPAASTQPRITFCGPTYRLLHPVHSAAMVHTLSTSPFRAVNPCSPARSALDDLLLRAGWSSLPDATPAACQ